MALCLPTFSHFLIVNKLLSPPPFVPVPRSPPCDCTPSNSSRACARSGHGAEGGGIGREMGGVGERRHDLDSRYSEVRDLKFD